MCNDQNVCSGVCSICLDEIDKIPSLIMTTECGHKFHYRECWKKYFDNDGESKLNSLCRPCPNCRTLVMYEDGGFFNTLDYLKALEELVIDNVDFDFKPLFYNTERSEVDMDRVIELRPIMIAHLNAQN